MKLAATLIAVTDMERSKRFYGEVLGLKVTADFGANVTLEGGLALQTAETWREFIRGRDPVFRHNSGELYFETRDLEGFLGRLEQWDVELVHPPTEHSWGQRVVRFYDPDGHMIEVGEEIGLVVERFAARGLDAAAIARRMDVPLDFVEQTLSR